MNITEIMLYFMVFLSLSKKSTLKVSYYYVHRHLLGRLYSCHLLLCSHQFWLNVSKTRADQTVG